MEETMSNQSSNLSPFALGRISIDSFESRLVAQGISFRNLSHLDAGEVVVGREDEIFAISKRLLSFYRPNILLTGQSGCGKTSLIEALAYRLRRASIERLANLKFIEVSAPALLAGTAYRGDFEKKLEVLVQAALEFREIVLFFDEAHTLAATGDNQGGVSALDILKPHLLNGRLKVILATTEKEVSYLKHDEAFMRRFAEVKVCPLSLELQQKAFERHLGNLENHYGFTLDEHQTYTTKQSLIDRLDATDMLFAESLLLNR
jgi:ATP-dependent Clp protease ATP-binding subunit ClpC